MTNLFKRTQKRMENRNIIPKALQTDKNTMLPSIQKGGVSPVDFKETKEGLKLEGKPSKNAWKDLL